MKLKKTIALLMTVLMVLGLMASCGNAESTTADTTAATAAAADTDAETAAAETEEEEPEDIADINVMYFTIGTAPSDVESVEEAINAITIDAINTNVSLLVMDMGSYLQQVNLMISGGEKLDLLLSIPVGAAQYNAMVSQNQLMPINDLLTEYGQGILEVVPESWLTATSDADGNILGVTPYGGKSADMIFGCRTDILEETGIKAEDIKSTDDLEVLFEKVKELHPELVPVGGGARNTTLFPGFNITGEFDDAGAYDTLGDTSMALASVFVDDPETVVNYYESEEWIESVSLIAKWYEKGYIDKDCATRDESSATLVQGGVAFGYFFEGSGNTDKFATDECGYDMTTIKVGTGMVSTSRITMFVWGIPTTSTEPEAAMKFLNLMYTDGRIVDLINYGVEGIHYEVKEDGTFGFLEGMDSTNTTYYVCNAALFGNQALAHDWEGEEPGTNALVEEQNANAIVSPINGFIFDSSGMENEYTAITSVINEYRGSLRCGLYTEELQAEFVEKLKIAGSDKLVAAAQEQLDAWLAAQK